MSVSSQKTGKIKLLVGPMFAGKTTALIKEANLSNSFLAFKPKIDNRYSDEQIVAHTEKYIDAIPVDLSESICKITSQEVDLVIIDEVQFFDQQIIDDVVLLKQKGLNVIVAGLDTDFRKEPFHITHSLQKIADEVEVLKAVCKQCGQQAEYTYRTSQSNEVIVVGGSENYEPRCLKCYHD